MSLERRRRFLLTSCSTGVAWALATGVAGRAAPEGRVEAAEADGAAQAELSKAELSPADLPKTDAEWKKKLTPEQYRVLRKKQTERAFSNKYWNSKRNGLYRCAGCGQALFESSTKFNSGTGWPSFWAPAGEDKVKQQLDESELPVRMEVVCSRCDGHLGHVFNDGPPPTGLRFCMNSAALKLEERAKAPAKPNSKPPAKPKN